MPFPSKKIDDVAAVVLAGGKGERLGRDKAVVPLGGKPLIEHVTAAAAKVFETVLIAGPARLAFTGYPAAPDETTGVGPLSGILAGLRATDAPWIFTLPCDSPFVSEAFLRGMAALPRNADVIVPRPSVHYEPLHALYSQSCRPHVERMIAAGERKILKLYDLVQVIEVPPEVTDGWDPDGMVFFNVNTQENFEAAQQRFTLLSHKAST